MQKRNEFCIHSFHWDDNAPCLPPKILHNHCFQFLLGITIVQEKIDVNSYHKLREVPHFSSGILKWAKRERVWKSPHARKEDTCGLFSVRKRTCFRPRNSKIVYQNSRLSTIPIFNMIKVNWYDNRGKISSQNFLKNLWIHTCSPTLKTDKNPPYIALFKRRNKPQNVLNISRGTSNMASNTLPT